MFERIASTKLSGAPASAWTSPMSRVMALSSCSTASLWIWVQRKWGLFVHLGTAVHHGFVKVALRHTQTRQPVGERGLLLVGPKGEGLDCPDFAQRRRPA